MRNRLKRDINRLVQHPRRRSDSRQLRAPGRLSSVYSSARGLLRTPPITDLDIFVLDDEYRILRMSPDMSTIKETLVTDDDIASFAIYDGRYLYAKHDTAQPNITNYVLFDNGASIATNWDPETDERRIVGANQTHALVHFVDDSALTAYIEKYDWEGSFVSRIACSSPDYNYGTESYWVIPATGDYVFISGYGPPSGSQQGWWRFNINTGAKSFVANNSKFWGDFCTVDRYYSVIYNDQKIEIRDLNLSLLGTLNLNRPSPTSFCVTHNKAYCFFGGSFGQETFVQIYSRDGDTFTLENEFDLNQTLGLRYIRVAMPDLVEVL